MAQFDVYRNIGPGAKHIPYVLDVQSDLVSGVATRIVVPLVRASMFNRSASRLHPRFEVDGVPVMMLTTELAGVLPVTFGGKVGSLADRWHEIRDALDFAFQGY
jgi:toxin CcdB